MNYFEILMSLLRDRGLFMEEIRQGVKLEQKILALLICSSLFFSIYGAIMGSFNSGLQMIASAIKLPALYLITLIICLPTLYFYEIISGSKCNFDQYLAWLLSSMAIISVLLFGFAPVTLFFRLSINDYLFFIFLNVTVLKITGIIGVNFFYRNMLSIADQNEELPKHRNSVLKSWLLLYAIVGSQLGWTLRPFFGNPNQPFSLFRDVESNFYLQMLRAIATALGLN